jgi:hypothetical protein
MEPSPRCRRRGRVGPGDAREAGEVARLKAENTRLSATIVDGSVS